MKPCQFKNDTIICNDGIITDVDHKCGDYCPTAKFFSDIAISSNNFNDNAIKCYGHKSKRSYNMIYQTTDQLGVLDDHTFTKTFCGKHHTLPCHSKAMGKYIYQECYNPKRL